PAAEDEPSLVRLADIEMIGAVGDHLVDQGLQGFSDEGLKDMGLDGKLEAGLPGEQARMPSDGKPNLARRDRALRRFHAGDPLALAQKARDLAILDDVDAVAVGRPGIAPGDSVMAGGAGAPLEQSAIDGKA